MEPPDLELRGLSKTYESGRGAPGPGGAAVSQLDLHIPRGQLFSLLGPSGCGKSTTLRMVAGFVEPSSGDILIRGQRVNELPPHLRDVNTTFQSYALFPHLDVYENIAFGLRRKGLPAREIGERVGWSLELVRLQGFERRKPSALSGGEQQRVAMARALVNRPALLLLDEPLSALDEKLRRQMQHELKRIQRETGTTFVMVTHDQQEALTMSDSVAVMHGGRIEQAGPPHELYEHPRTRFVAEFMGGANFFEAEVVGADATSTHVRAGDALLALPHQPGLAPGARLELTVRPERMRLEAPPQPSEAGSIADEGGMPLPGPTNRLQATLVDTTYQGATTRYELRTTEGAPLVVVRPSEEARSVFRPSGDSSVVWVTWPSAATRVLSAPCDEHGVQGTPSTPHKVPGAP